MERAPVEEVIRIALAGPMFLSAPQHVKTVALGCLGLFKKHRKNCECCPCQSLFKGHKVIVNIVVLNYQQCNQCLKCHM